MASRRHVVFFIRGTPIRCVVIYFPELLSSRTRANQVSEGNREGAPRKIVEVDPGCDSTLRQSCPDLIHGKDGAFRGIVDNFINVEGNSLKKVT